MSKEEITLQHPVTVDGGEISLLHMRRPKVRDMLIADKHSGGSGAKEVAMFANLCEIDPSVIEDLDLLDYGKLQATYRGFLS